MGFEDARERREERVVISLLMWYILG